MPWCYQYCLFWCYQYCLLNSRVWYRHCTHLPSKVQPLLPLLLVIPVGLLDVNLLGGSHMLIDHLIALPSHSAAFASLFGLLSIYFVVRFVGSMLSYGAPVPGESSCQSWCSAPFSAPCWPPF